MSFPFETRLAASWPPEAWRDVTVLVAVSGGADSVALLRGLAALKSSGAGRLVVGHFNHQLRAAADEDERFVVALADRLELACEVGRPHVAEQAVARSDGLEAAARQSRYAFLLSAAERHGARYVATAHTADDQAETVLHRMVRGTGIAGLAGIPRARPLSAAVTLLRPLLGFRRAEVIEYLAAREQPFREDETNLDRGLTRNRIRHALVPLLERDFNPNVVEALVRLGQLAGEAQEVLARLAAEEVERRATVDDRGSVRLATRGLAELPRYLVRELFVALWREQGWPQQAMGFDEWELLASLAVAPAEPPSPPQMLPGAILARRQGEQLLLEPARAKSNRGRDD